MAVKYYSDEWPTNSAKETFEKAVFSKTQKSNARNEGNQLFVAFWPLCFIDTGHYFTCVVRNDILLLVIFVFCFPHHLNFDLEPLPS